MLKRDDEQPEIIPPWDPNKKSGLATWEQKRRLARAMRLVIERLVPSNAPEKELRAAADALEEYAERLKSHPRLRRVVGHAEAATAGDVGAFFDQSPMIGLSNPLAPPITVGKTGDKTAAGRVRFGSAYEGPPGSVHGGYVAAAFDEVLGYVQSLSGNPGFTANLSIDYRKPTPLHTDLLIEAELLDVRGRKIFTKARMRAGELVTAEARGLFISIGREQVDVLMKKRALLEEAQTG